MSLREKFLKLKQSSYQYTTNPLLYSIDLNVIQKIEEDCEVSPYLKEVKEELERRISSIPLDYNVRWNEIYNIYSEAQIFMYLYGLLIIRRNVKKESKTSDFSIKFNGQEFCAEIKSLLAVNANETYRKIFQEGLENKIELERQIRKGRGFGATEQTIKSYRNSCSKKGIIESIIDKIRQNYKSGQFLDHDTILIVDLRQLGILSSSSKTILPYFYDNQSSSIISGELWHVSFGKINNIILNYPEFEGKANFDGDLEKDGILNEYTNIKALIFQTSWLVSNKMQFVGLYRRNDCHIKNLLERICTYVNTDKNDNEYLLLKG